MNWARKDSARRRGTPRGLSLHDKPWRNWRSAIAVACSALLATVGLVAGAAPASAAEACGPAPVWVNTSTALIEFDPSGVEISRAPLARTYTNISFSSDGLRLYGLRNNRPVTLYTVDPATGAEVASVTVTGLPAVGMINALSSLPDGRLLLAMAPTSTIFVADPVTGVATTFGAFPTGFRSAGDFVTLLDGDILAAANPVGVTTHSVLFRIHPNGTATQIGRIPPAAALTQAGGVIYMGGTDQYVRSVDQIPVLASDDDLPVTIFADAGAAINGATSMQNAGCGVYVTHSKVADKPTYSVGDPITYDISVTNRGNKEGLISFADTLPARVGELSAICAPPLAGPCSTSLTGHSLTGLATVPPGGTQIIRVTGVVQQIGSVSNTVFVLVVSPGCDVFECGSGASSTGPLTAAAGLSLVKTASSPTQVGNEPVSLGDSLAYSFTVTNIGNINVDNITITDPLLAGVICPATTLVPAESMTCEGSTTHTVVEADVVAGEVVNTATVVGVALVDGIAQNVTASATARTAIAPSPEDGPGDGGGESEIPAPENGSGPEAGNSGQGSSTGALASTGGDVPWLPLGLAVLFIAAAGIIAVLRREARATYRD